MNGISFFKRSLLCLCTGLLVVTGGEFSSAYAKETVKVGFVGPLTGGLSSLGMGGRNSVLILPYRKEMRIPTASITTSSWCWTTKASPTWACRS